MKMIVKQKVVLSKSVVLTTIIFMSILVATMFFTGYCSFKEGDTVGRIISLFSCVVLFMTILIVYMYRPRYVILSDSQIILEKGVGKIGINYADIDYVKSFCDNGIGDLRLFGIGGIFGYIGIFRNKTIGTYTAYIGDYSQAIHIRTKKNKNYVISCENRNAFFKKLSQIASNLNSAT